jgi:hypothetical protein
MGDGWAIIASRNGCYYFTGGTPEKISQEIQPLWDTINWQYGHTIWTATDTAAKRVYIGAPFGVETSPKSFLVLDYVEGFGDPVGGGGGGRKWTRWNSDLIPSVYHGAMVEASEMTAKFVLATGVKEMYVYDKTAVNDVASPFCAINAYYETAPIGTDIGRSLFDRIIMRIRGAGTLTVSKVTPAGTVTSVGTKTLTASPDDDVEVKMRDIQTQVGFRFGTNAIGASWNMRRMAAFIKLSPYTYLRKT